MHTRWECVKGAPNVFKVVDGQFVIDTSADSEDNIRAYESLIRLNIIFHKISEKA